MNKNDILKKIEKFDLTEVQLKAIENIIAGEFEFSDYKEILFEVSERISKVKNVVIDIGVNAYAAFTHIAKSHKPTLQPKIAIELVCLPTHFFQQLQTNFNYESALYK